jgi:thioredoxin-like negative regulator of GroEL
MCCELNRDNTDVVFLMVDVDECGDIAEECEVNAMPTFHFYKGGDKLDTVMGASQEKLEEAVAKYK